MESLSERGQAAIVEFDSSIAGVEENVYDEKTNPGGVISLGLAENHIIHDYVTDYINKTFHVDSSMATTYTGTNLGGIRLRKAFASHINAYFSPSAPITSEEVLVANGVSAICAMLAFILGDQGDGVLLMKPIYGRFENDWGVTAKMKTLYTDMGDTDPFSEAVVDRYTERLHEAQQSGIRVRALQISNPHNPSGLCYPAATLRALSQFCKAHNLHLISDEIYALSIFPTPPPATSTSASLTPTPTTFTSLLSLPYSPHHHVEYGLSKDFGAAGLHVGALITFNAAVAQSFNAMAILHAPGGPSCVIAASILEDRQFVESVISLSCSKLGENYKAVTKMLDDAGIPYWRGGNAGYFLWVNLSSFLPPSSATKVVAESGNLSSARPEKETVGRGKEAEKALAATLLRDGKVWLNPGEENSEKEGWFRIIFAHKKDKIVEGVRRIIATLSPTTTAQAELPTRPKGEI